MVDPNSDPDQDQPTNQPQPLDRRWVFDLLTDPEIDMMPENATAAARLNTPAYALKCVASWWLMPDRRSAGLLVTWLVRNATDRKKRYRPGPANAEFLASDLYRRHYDAAWSLASDSDPPQWVLDLPDPPRVLEYQSADGQVFRVPEGRRGGGT